MPRFQVQIHGQNFRLLVEGKAERLGFYTPRLVDAPDAATAVQFALGDFRRSQKFQTLVAAAMNAESDPPLLSGEDVEEVLAGDGSQSELIGLTFYKDESED